MQETASSLVRGIQDFQNHQRWFEFYQRYGPLIRSILAQRGFKGSELDDAAQDVYLSMLATIERFKYNRGRGTFRSWLSRITHRTAKKYRERHESDDHEFPVDPQQLSRSTPGAPKEAIPNTTDQSRMDLCLELARSQFDQKTWLAFYLRCMEQTSIDEIVRITEMSRNGVYQAIHRVRSCLGALLAQLDQIHEDH